MEALIVGWDGLSIANARQWIQKGTIPALEQMAGKGAWGPLESVPTADLASAWASLASGLDPGRHGVFFGDRHPLVPTPHKIPQPVPFWDRLAQNGYRVAVMGVPTEGRAASRKAMRSCPEGTRLTRWLLAGEEVRVERAIKACLESQLALVEKRLRSERPDVVIVALSALDLAWRFLATQEIAEEIGQRLSDALAGWIETFQPRRILLFSTSGGRAAPCSEEDLTTWLVEAGYLVLQKGGSLIRRGVWWEDVDWHHTVAYCVGPQQIYVHITGRGRPGGVPAWRHEALCQEIADRLLETVDPSDNQAAVEEVLFGQDVYHGPLARWAPDLLIRWRRGRVLRALKDPEGKIVPISSPIPPGARDPLGVLFALGIGIQSGHFRFSRSVIDVAPTVMYWLGEPIPAGMDGTVALEWFAPEWVAFHPVIRDQRWRATGRRVRQVTEDRDAALIEERLRGLGYIE